MADVHGSPEGDNVRYWEGFGAFDLGIILVVLALAAALRRLVPAVGRLAVPDAILAGAVALLLGPSALGWLPFDPAQLEGIVYHGLALLFLTVGLQPRATTQRTGGARSIAFAIPIVAALQASIGLVVVLAWPLLTSDTLHPGHGMMLPLGFSQGPGQALALGTSWEASGMQHGGQVGLILAAIGFATCCLVGVPMVHLARWRGWSQTPGSAEAVAARSAPAGARLTAGAVLHLLQQLAVMAALYLATFGVLKLLSTLLAARPQIAVMVWGFHFIVALLLALALRPLTTRLDRGRATDDTLFSRATGLLVNVCAACAIAAVRIEVLQELWRPILAVAVPGALFSALAHIWLGRRAFPDQPFGHALVLFGANTGTLPTGLALLRVEDPELAGPPAKNILLGVAGAVPLSVPLLIFLLPMPIVGWPETYPGSSILALVLLLSFCVVLIVVWRWVGPLRFVRPLWHLWPERPDS